MIELNQETFQEFINSEEKVIVDFYGVKCGGCETLLPFLEQAANHHPNRIAKIKVNDFIELAMEYNIRQIPTMLVFQNQKQIAKRIGSVKNVAVILEMIS